MKPPREKVEKHASLCTFIIRLDNYFFFFFFLSLFGINYFSTMNFMYKVGEGNNNELKAWARVKGSKLLE